MGSGVAGALWRAANGPINEEAMAKDPLDLGEVAITDAYDLNTDYVIHAAAMSYYGDRRATPDSVRRATRNTLKATDSLGCESFVVRPRNGCRQTRLRDRCVVRLRGSSQLRATNADRRSGERVHSV
jgi:O-acetyl-ADP-ribose deacetylase (regulator of RNase III)